MQKVETVYVSIHRGRKKGRKKNIKDLLQGGWDDI